MLLGVGDVISVRVPYAMPDRRNPLAFNPGQGCATLLAGFAALAVQGVLLIPIAVVAGVVLHTQSLARRDRRRRSWSPTRTARAIWLLGRNIAWRFVWWRLPELLAAVSPRQAG